MLEAVADAAHGARPDRAALTAIVDGMAPEAALELSGLTPDDHGLAVLTNLADTDRWLAEDHEITAILRALDGRFIRPAPAGDLLRTPAILPTGRNLHGFDPSASPAPSLSRTAPGRRSGSSPATAPTACPCRKPSRSSCGAPTI